MGKNYCFLIAILAFIGATVAGYLAYSHYFPKLIEKFVVCGGEYAGNCDALNQWEYASILGIPIAAYGLFMFLLILFTALIVDYAAGEYYAVGFMLVLPLIVLSLLADILLASVMIWLKTFCLLCGITYFINVLLLLISYAWYRHLTSEGFSLWAGYRSLLMNESDIPQKKVVAALYVLIVLLLFFSILSTSYVLQIKTYPVRQSEEQMHKAVQAFYLQTPENLELPASRLRIGPDGAKVQIVAFTDFLCSACFKFFQLEKELHAQYAKDKALAVADGLVDAKRFQQEIDGEVVNQIVQRDIKLAEKLHIEATPTLFINGRRIEGVPPREIMEGIIEKELKNSSMQ